MDHFTIILGSHYLKIRNPTYRIAQILLWFSKRYTVQTVSKDPTEGRVFGIRVQDGIEWRFHRGQLPELISELTRQHISPAMYDIVERTLSEPTRIECQMLPSWVLRDYQLDIQSFLTQDVVGDGHSRLVAIGTGKGKTVSALSAMPGIGYRTAIVVLPAYIDKWASDIRKILDVPAKSIMLVQGSGQLRGLIDLAEADGLTSPFILISLSTIKLYYKAYEQSGSAILGDYGVLPEDLWEHLGVGTLLIDEAHQHLHAVYKMLTYSHVQRCIALSATMLSDDPTVRRIQQIMFPKSIRYEQADVVAYIKCYAVEYQWMDYRAAKLRTSEFGNNNYSHNAYEKSIMRQSRSMQGYLKMIDFLIQAGYLRDYQPGDRLMVFASRVEMCTIITNHLKARHPQLDVRRYVEDDPYENVIDADIRVSTIQSSGTAIDIPQLTCTILTTSIRSSQSNIQAIGRLREIPGRDVRFYYLYCNQIRKQIDYHRAKLDLLRPYTSTIKEVSMPFSI